MEIVLTLVHSLFVLTYNIYHFNYINRYPSVTGTSVLGVKYNDGVILAADMLGSYGSLARFRNLSRVKAVNNSTGIAVAGDYADYQFLNDVLEQKM